VISLVRAEPCRETSVLGVRLRQGHTEREDQGSDDNADDESEGEVIWY
jgi:hypothetical protein